MTPTLPTPADLAALPPLKGGSGLRAPGSGLETDCRETEAPPSTGTPSLPRSAEPGARSCPSCPWPTAAGCLALRRNLARWWGVPEPEGAVCTCKCHSEKER